MALIRLVVGSSVLVAGGKEFRGTVPVIACLRVCSCTPVQECIERSRGVVAACPLFGVPPQNVVVVR